MSGGYILENGDFLPDSSQESIVAPLPVDSVCGAVDAPAETLISVSDTAIAVDSTGG